MTDPMKSIEIIRSHTSNRRIQFISGGDFFPVPTPYIDHLRVWAEVGTKHEAQDAMRWLAAVAIEQYNIMQRFHSASQTSHHPISHNEYVNF